MSRLGFVRRVFALGTFVTAGAFLVTSCLTPEFDFGSDAISGSGGLGGAGSNPAAHCTNRQQDADETDVDCGGEDCSPCRDGSKCVQPSDCLNNVCEGGECQAPSCDDRVKNGTESDVDCGGSCDPCGLGLACVVAADCESPPADDPALAQCVEKICTLLCAGGTEDCNENAADGCEVNTLDNVDNCGACGSRCRPDNATGTCFAGTCLIEACAPGFANINGDVEDGCEVDTNTDPNHCGPERIKCSSQNGTPRCDNGACAIECDAGFDDCNDDLADGCETNLLVNVLHCNECGNKCDEGEPNESPNCVDGTCGKTVCDPGVGDCDGDQVCTDDLTSVANCGTCGNDCVARLPNAEVACESGSCVIESCKPGFDDCNEEAAGCETILNTDAKHCGGCNQPCSDENVQELKCTMGTCTPVCDPNFCPAPNPANGCTQPKGTPENCATCGEVCEGETPFCIAGSGCASYHPVTIEHTDTSGHRNLPGALTLTHNLKRGVGNHRVVVVGVTSLRDSNCMGEFSVTYNGTDMDLAVSRPIGGSNLANIYYLLDDDLPSVPDDYDVVVTSDCGWGGVAANVVELSSVEQVAPVHTRGSLVDSGCSSNTHSANVPSAHPQSFIYVTAFAWGNSVAEASPSGLTAELHNGSTIQGRSFFGYRGPETSNRTVGWTGMNGCFQSGLATATFGSRITP